MAMWMLWDSKIGKMRNREQLLDAVRFTANARVLDVGCGRGLHAHRRCQTAHHGNRISIDLWQLRISPAIAPKRRWRTRSVKACPIASTCKRPTCARSPSPTPPSTSLSLLSHPQYLRCRGTPAAIAEIARVLKPGGEAVIDDIRHGREYAASFAANGCTSKSVGSSVMAVLMAILTMGSLRPVTLVVRKTPDSIFFSMRRSGASHINATIR